MGIMLQTKVKVNIMAMDENVPEECPGTEESGKASACEGCPNQNICTSAGPAGFDPDIDTIAERLSDFLLVDTPPGTSDEHLSLVQYLAAIGVDGAVIVTSREQIFFQL